MKNCIDFCFNGKTSQDMNLLNVQIDSGEWTHPLSNGKTITTAKSIYSNSNIITKITAEPLTFTLNFVNRDWSPFTSDRIAEIFSYFDVQDYAPISFSDNPKFYYNVIPLTSATDINLHSNNTGYLTMEFLADSNCGYIDWEKEFTAENTGYLSERIINNTSNVLNCYGNYNVYPYITVNTLARDDFFIGNGATGLGMKINNLSNNEIIEIDGVNKQVYSSLTKTKNLSDFEFYTMSKNNSVVTWERTEKIDFPYFVKGSNELYFWEHISRPFICTMKAAFPRIE